MLQNFGTALSREQMKNVIGGYDIGDHCEGTGLIFQTCTYSTYFSIGGPGGGPGVYDECYVGCYPDGYPGCTPGGPTNGCYNGWDES